MSALILASCGGSSGESADDSNDAKATLSACECKKELEKLVKEAFDALDTGDESSEKDIEAKVKELEEDCKDYSEADYKECK